MPDLRMLDVVDYCLALASECVERGYDLEAGQIMNAGFAKIARQVSLWEMSGEFKSILFLRPMEKRLLELHGPTVGLSLFLDFIDSFWLQSWTDVPLDPARLARNIAPTAEWHRQILIRHQSSRRIEFVGLTSSLPSEN